MKKDNYKIYIIGAGISGLIAAKTLENRGYKPTIIESTDSIGGRVKTDVVNGYQLDHGFQVLLSAYPKAKEHLDFKALELQTFLPGAAIYTNGKTELIGDVLRDMSFFFSNLTASVGTFKDKLKILKLNTSLKNKSIYSIFESKSKSTLDYLKDYGFSNKIINSFFRPFFSGIFLEPNLETSSRMFEFVYKMFGQGLAVLPKKGIGAIAEQLKSQLNNTTIRLNTTAKTVTEHHIELADGSKIDIDYCIVTAGAEQLIADYNQEIQWKSCYNLYFETKKRTLNKPLIGLIADDNSLINNLFFCNSLETTSKGNAELLSVTVVKAHNLNPEELIKQVEEELNTLCNISVTRHIKTYYIKKALPKLNTLHNVNSISDIKIKPTVFLAGDYLLNSSLNAAMLSGERAAEAIIADIEEQLIVK